MLAYLTAIPEDEYCMMASLSLSLRTSIMIAYLTAVSEDKYYDRLPYRCPWGRVLWWLTLLLSLRTRIMIYDGLPNRCLLGRVLWPSTLPLSLRTSIMIAYLPGVLWWQVLWSSTLPLSLMTSIMMAYLTTVSEDEYYDGLPYHCLWGRVLWWLTLPLSLRTSVMIVHLLPLPPRMSSMLTMTARTIRPAIQVSWPRVIWL